MKDEYKVFSEKYNKMLDLVEKVDPQLAAKYERFISKMPTTVVKKLKTKEKFVCDGEDYRVDFDSYGDMIEFQYTKYRKFFNTSMNIYPFYEDELLEEDEEDDETEISPEIAEDEDGDLFIFSLTMTNCEEDATIKVNYELVDGKYIYKGTKLNGVELDYSVFIEKREEDFFLVRVEKLNGFDASKIEVPISYEELLEYAILEDEEEFQEDEEMDDFEDYPELNEDIDGIEP